MKPKRITGSWLAYASIDPRETELLISHVTASSHDVESASTGDSTRFWLKDLGSLGSTLEDSPVVVIYPPRMLSDRLYTLGRFFFPQPQLQKRYPAIAKIREQIQRDLKNADNLWTFGTTEKGPFDYFLEGYIANRHKMVYGLPSSIRYLQTEGYFVHGDETDAFMDTLRRKLALRGVKI